jgi:hypothetical protein
MGRLYLLYRCLTKPVARNNLHTATLFSEQIDSYLQ